MPPIKISQKQQQQQPQPQQYDQQNHYQQHQQQQQHSRQADQQLQQHYLMRLQTIKQQLIQHNIITKQQLESILYQQEQQQQQQHNNNNINSTTTIIINPLFTIITHLTASLIQHNQHLSLQKQLHLQQVQNIKQQVINNDQHIINALQLFHHLAQELVVFSQLVYSNQSINSNISKSQLQQLIPVQVCKHFRQVYQITQQLASIFNKYQFTNQQTIQKRNIMLQEQIKLMQKVFANQQLQYRQQINQQNKQGDRYQTTQQNNQLHLHPHPTNLPTPTSQYILSLREQITNLHQTLIKNDEQFTTEIQNYNKTIRQLTQTVKAYEIELAKIIHYQLKIEQLQKVLVRFREDKYKNEIVIENMAKKIRNYQKDLRGDQSFFSPQRSMNNQHRLQQHNRLVSSPQSRYSMLNSKVSVVNSIKSGHLLFRQRQQQQQQAAYRIIQTQQLNNNNNNNRLSSVLLIGGIESSNMNAKKIVNQ